MAFRARKVFGTFKKRTPGRELGRRRTKWRLGLGLGPRLTRFINSLRFPRRERHFASRMIDLLWVIQQHLKHFIL